MYCISCGVKLADSEKNCPLCGLEVYHPHLNREVSEGQYPPNRYPIKEVSPWGKRLIVLVIFLLPLLTVLLCDLPVYGQITWSGYVIGALIVLYAIVMLPQWFRHPNPAVLVPIDFAVIGGYLLYINWAVEGTWFMTFAFPVTAFCAVVMTAFVSLLRYVRRGRIFVFGGTAIALGLFFPVMELLLDITFVDIHFIGWAFFPMSALLLFGGLLIFLGTCRPAREMMERKFFI